MQINLLPQPSPFQQTRSIVLLSVAGAMVLANLWIGVSWFGASSEKKLQERILQDANRRIEVLHVELEKKIRLETQANQYQVLSNWSASRPNFQTEVHLLSSLLPEKSFLARVEFLEERTFELQAVLPNMESVATYLRLLEEEPTIERVLVQNVARREDSGTDSGNSSSTDSNAPQREVYYLSWSGLWQRLWSEYIRPLFSIDVAYASDDGLETWEKEEDQDMGEWNDSSNGGQGSGEQGSGGQGSGGQSSSTQKSKPAISYELNLQVTMKRDF